MPNIVEIEETVSRTVQVQQYEPVTITSKVKVILDDGDNIAEMKHKYIKGLVAVVEADLQRFYSRKK